MPERTEGWLAQQQDHCSGGALTAGKCTMMEYLKLSRERRQKQRDSPRMLLPVQAVGWASFAGRKTAALPHHTSVRLALLIIPASSQAYGTQQVGCEALWWSLINLCHVQCLRDRLWHQDIHCNFHSDKIPSSLLSLAIYIHFYLTSYSTSTAITVWERPAIHMAFMHTTCIRLGCLPTPHQGLALASKGSSARILTLVMNLALVSFLPQNRVGVALC